MANPSPVKPYLHNIKRECPPGIGIFQGKTAIGQDKKGNKKDGVLDPFAFSETYGLPFLNFSLVMFALYSLHELINPSLSTVIFFLFKLVVMFLESI